MTVSLDRLTYGEPLNISCQQSLAKVSFFRPLDPSVQLSRSDAGTVWPPVGTPQFPTITISLVKSPDSDGSPGQPALPSV